MNTSRWIFGIMLSTVWATVQGAMAADAAGDGPPIRRLVWQAPQRIEWRLAQGPVWHSLGHGNRVVCFIPRGEPAAAGDAGQVQSVDIEIHEVTAFDRETGRPAATGRIARETLRAADPGEPRQTRWPFPTEQTFDWELSRLPPGDHQRLFRIFLHDGMPFWHTLMVHLEFETTPAALEQPPVFTDMRVHVIVCELLHDPALPLTSTYIEPDDPPSTNWIGHLAVPPPWSVNRQSLAPAAGSMAVAADGPARFLPLTDTARRAGDIRAGTGSRPELPPDIGERLHDLFKEDEW